MRKCESVGGSRWAKEIMLCIYGRDLTGRVLSHCSPRGVVFGEVGERCVLIIKRVEGGVWKLLPWVQISRDA